VLILDYVWLPIDYVFILLLSLCILQLRLFLADLARHGDLYRIFAFQASLTWGHLQARVMLVPLVSVLQINLILCHSMNIEFILAGGNHLPRRGLVQDWIIRFLNFYSLRVRVVFAVIFA